MQHIGRVRNTTHTKETPCGYVDMWAGVVRNGKRFVPLMRHRCARVYPSLASQNQLAEQVLTAAQGMLAPTGVSTIVVADRGFGRKPLLIR
jgi:hypothetical protein